MRTKRSEFLLELYAMRGLRNNGRKVVCEYEGGERMGSGVIQSVKINKDKTDWEVTVSDGEGGAFSFPLSELLLIHVSKIWDQPDGVTLTVSRTWVKGGAS